MIWRISRVSNVALGDLAADLAGDLAADVARDGADEFVLHRCTIDVWSSAEWCSCAEAAAH